MKPDRVAGPGARVFATWWKDLDLMSTPTPLLSL